MKNYKIDFAANTVTVTKTFLRTAQQLIQNYNTTKYSKLWDAIATDEILYWESVDKSIVVITYAKFGKLIEHRPDFHTHFKYIICDELPSLIKYQYFEKRPNGYDEAFQVEKTNFGRGALLVKFTDSTNKTRVTPHLDYLTSVKGRTANATISNLEEGDYEVALMMSASVLLPHPLLFPRRLA